MRAFIKRRPICDHLVVTIIKNNYSKLVTALLLSVLAAVLGSIPIIFARGIEWQDRLSKPFFSPPNWLFGPAWTVLFLFMAIAFYLVWMKWPGKDVKMAMALYLAQLTLNVLWNYLFFGLQSATGMMLALAEIIVLLAMIALTTHRFYQVDRRAGYLMVPYLLWVAFAACLNAALWLMNPGA
jgi:translocator protein